MERRDFLKWTMMASSAVFSLPLFCSGFRQKPESPNILFLFADDQCSEALSAFGSEVLTPNLDKLVSRGVSFSNAYNQGAWHGAVCVASRTMLITGRFLWDAKRIEPVLNQELQAGRLWPQYLAKAGYDTYMSGKWHVKVDAAKTFQTTKNIRPGMPAAAKEGYNRPTEGVKDLWSPWDRNFGGYWEGGKHWSEILGDDAVEFIAAASNSTNPFFMYLAFNAPHDPRQSPEKYVDRYPVDSINIPENFLPEYPFENDIGCGKGLRDERLAPFPRTEYAVKVHRREYYAIISHMDAQIGRILDALEKSGKAKDTYIFFTADHGLAVGHHGLLGKQNMFEHSMKAPLIVTGPDIPNNQRIETPVYLQDIFPTTLELAGISKPDHVRFKSLLPLMAGTREKNYETIYGGYIDLQRMVRKDNFKLIYYPKIQKILLFDLKQDPYEMNDLSENRQYESKMNELKQELIDLQQQVGDSLKLNWW